MSKDLIRKAIDLRDKLESVAPKTWLPPSEGTHAESEMVVYMPLVRGTRGYIEKIANQINGCYEKGWYDGCSVLIRRLLETLIIEVFESKGIESKIKKNGNYMFLRDMIAVTVVETSLNLGRNTKTALPKLKDIGDKSAHSRRYIALRHDIDDVKTEIRTVIQELMFVSKLKK